MQSSEKTPRLAAIDKFALLKRYVCLGSAASAIAYLKPIANNYGIFFLFFVYIFVVFILRKKYDQPRRLKRARIQAISDLDAVTRTEDHKALRLLYDQANC